MEEALGGTVEKRAMTRREGIVACEREDGRVGTELQRAGGGALYGLGVAFWRVHAPWRCALAVRQRGPGR